MPYDPTKPANGALIVAAELRDQSNSLKALIDALTAQVGALQTQLTNLQNQVNNCATQTDLSNAISDTPHSLNPVGQLSSGVSDPVQQGEMQAIYDKVNEMLGTAYR